VALSNETILILCTFGFATLGITLFLILRNQPKYDEEDERLIDRHRDNYGDELDKADAATLNRAQRRARAKYKMKQARRDMAPVVQVAARAGGDNNDDDDDNNIAADGGRIDGDNDVVDNNTAEGNPNRRERQRLAKQMERKERKMYSLEAQRWREKNSVAKSDMKSKTKKNDDGDMTSTQNICTVEDKFPQRLDNNDPLSDIIFWKAIISSIKSRQHDDILSSDEVIISQLQSRTMTIREFIERVEFDGSVSIIDLADEWDISISDALREIEQLKELYNISGVVDSSGNYSILEIKAA
jgi:hypothetical protein